MQEGMREVPVSGCQEERHHLPCRRVSIRFHTKCKWPKARSLADTVLDRCSERITFGLDLIYLYWSFDTSLPIVLSNATTRGAVVSDLIHPSMKARMPSLKHFNKDFTCHLKLI